MELAELQAKIGENVGTTEWFAMDQARINAFADCTEDQQFIHVDPEAAKAAAAGPPAPNPATPLGGGQASVVGQSSTGGTTR